VELQHVVYFLAVADSHGVNAAAAAENVSQPTISQAIRRLERELGVVLFHRIGSGMELTSAGHSFLGPARRIVRAAMVAEGSAVGEELRGSLDILAGPGLAVGPLADLIGRFKRRAPLVTVRVGSLASDDSVISVLRDGLCEIAVCHLPADSAAVPGTTAVSYLELGVHEPWMLFPPRTDLPPGPVRLADLPDVPLVVSTGGAEVTAIRNAITKDGTLRRPVVIVEQREARFAMVVAGIGATFIERTIAQDAIARGAVARPLEPALRVRFGLAYDPAHLSPVGAQFLAIARQPAPD
jgi:DNA-binding transcriptional LysR family regulator